MYGFDDAEIVFVENLDSSKSRFRHTLSGATFLWEPEGIVGSIQQIPRRVESDPWFQRAYARGKLKKVPIEELEERQAGLQIVANETSALDQIQQALAEGAGEKSGSRYVREGLSDFGRETGEISPEEVFGAKKQSQGPQRVRRSGSIDPVLPSETEPSGPGVVTAPVREGEWRPDVG